MSSLDFTITFHSPFRIGGAYGTDGAQQSVETRDALPADSLKGLMRAAAVDLLGGQHALVGLVFGTHATPSPWAWQAAHPTGDWIPSIRHRVMIDTHSHSALSDHLVQGQQVWAERAHFVVDQVRYIPPAYLDDHHSLLRVSAGHVHGLGAWRRRGLGWVHITPVAAEVTRDDVERVLAARRPDPAVGTGGGN